MATQLTRMEQRAQNRFGNFQNYIIPLYSAFVISLAGVLMAQKGEDQFSKIFIGIGALLVLSSAISLLIIFYRIWDFVITGMKRAGMKPAISSPGKAVGFLFIPFFNFYWMFRAYGQLPSQINALLNMRGEVKSIHPAFGNLLAVLTLLSLPIGASIPVSIVNALVLMPIFVSKCLTYSKQLFAAGSDDSDIVQVHSGSDKVKLTKMRDFPSLFTSKYGFNLQLISYLLIATALSSLTLMVVIHLKSKFYFWESVLDSVNLTNLLFILAFVISMILISKLTLNKIFFSLLCGLFMAIYGILHQIVMSFYFDIIAQNSSYQIRLLHSSIYLFISYSIMVGALTTSIYYLGIRWWNILVTVILSPILTFYIDGLVLKLIDHSYKFPEPVAHLYSLPWSLFLGMAIYLGIRQHLKQMENVPALVGK